MKTKILFLTLVITAVAMLGCQAAPPTQRTDWFEITQPTAGATVTGGTILKAHFADNSWTTYMNYSATNGQTIEPPIDPQPWDIYVMFANNPSTGYGSQYSAIWTNAAYSTNVPTIIPLQ